MQHHRTWSGWLALVIALAAALPYLGTLGADFVWDDDLLVVDHAYYRDPSLFWSVFTRNLIFSPNYYRPVGLLTFFGDFQLYRFRPWGYHLTNVLFHALASALAFLVLRRLFRGPPAWLPFGLALVFAWHPIHVEAVCFVAGRFDLLCGLFYLLALFLGLAAWDARRFVGRIGLGLAAGLAWLVALGSKEMAVTLPLALAACWAWRIAQESAAGDSATRRGTIHRAPANEDAMNPTPTAFPARAWPMIATLGLSGLGYLTLRRLGLGYLYVSQPEAAVDVGNLAQHALLVGRSVVRYLQLLIFPWGGLSAIHYAKLPLSTADSFDWLALELTLALVALVVWLLVRRRAAAWLWLAFALSLLPVVNLLPLEVGGGAFISERFAYLPSFFFLAAVGAVGLAVGARFIAPTSLARAQSIPPVLVGAFAVACLTGVLVTVPHWRDDVTLWTWATQTAPRSDVPWVNLGVQAGNRGEAELALDYANRALALNPNNATAHDTAGLALFLLKEYARAEEAFRNALKIEPNDAHLWSNLGGAVREQGRLEEASHILIDQALARDPTLWTAHLGLGLCHLAAGHPELAVEPFRQAVHYQPQAKETWERLVGALVATGKGVEALDTMAQSPFVSADAWFTVGNELLAARQPADALRAYDRALVGTDPVQVHLQRSLAFMQLGDARQAQAALQAGLALAPNDGRLYNNLGMILRDSGDPNSALKAFQTAWQLLPDSTVVAGNLATTYRALGQTEEADRWQKLAEKGQQAGSGQQ